VIEEHVHEDLKCMAHEEELGDLDLEKEIKDQVSNFLHYCLILLSNPNVVRKLTQMLATRIGEEGTKRIISTPY
jgi:hypothetical protein